MNKIISILFFLSIFINIEIKAQTISDTNSIEFLMLKADEALKNNNIELSNKFYYKVLKIDSQNYDAKYGLADNFFKNKNYKKSFEVFFELYQNKPENIDVVGGVARNLIKLEEYDKAKNLLKKSIDNSIVNTELLIDYAFIFIVKNKLDSAIYIYKEILNKDDKNIEALTGLGKLYYWRDKPSTSLKYYSQALKLNPDDVDLKRTIEKVKSELNYNISLNFYYVSESEESYNISAFIQKYSFEKRIGNKNLINFNTLWDYSARNNLYFDNVYRWYDNTWFKHTFLLNSNRISLFAGYSFNDKRVTSYGATWSTAFNIKKLKIKNYLTAAYDYFYYWNQVGQNFIQNSIIFSIYGIHLSGMYKYGILMDNVVIIKDKVKIKDNAVNKFNVEIKYDFLKKPKLSFGLFINNTKYKYSSPLFYTPLNRYVYGCSLSGLYNLNSFYNYFEFSYGIDNFKTSQTNGSLEIGYDFKKFSFSLSGNYFYNKYYKSYSTLVSIKHSF